MSTPLAPSREGLETAPAGNRCGLDTPVPGSALDCLSTLGRVRDALTKATDWQSALDGVLRQIAAAIPCELLALERIDPGLGVTEFFAALAQGAESVDPAALNEALVPALARRLDATAAAGPTCLVEPWPGSDRRPALVGVLPALAPWTDVLLVVPQAPADTGPAAQGLLGSVLMLVQVFWERELDRRRTVRLHRQVQRAKQEWQAGVDALPLMVCLLDHQGRVVRANRGLERLGLGSVQTVAGREFTALLAELGVLDEALQAAWPADSARGEEGALPPDLESAGAWLWERWCSALAAGPIVADSLRTPLGRCFELRLQHNLAATLDEHPLPQYVAVLQDVTERNRARDLLEDFNRRLRAQVAAKTASLRWANRRLQLEIEEHKLHKAALELSEYRYHSFVDKTLTGIYLAERGVITYHNRRFARLLGVEEGDLVGARLADVLGPGWAQHTPLVDDLGEVTSGQECQVGTRDGRLLWLHHIQAAYGANSRDIVIGNLLDITARKEVEERLLMSSERNAELSKRLLISQEEERARLARELHDGVGQRINAVKLMLDGIIRACDRSGGSPFQGHLLQLAASLRETVDEVRQVSMALRPSMLDDLGIRATLSWFVREMGRCVPYLRIDLDHDVDEAAMAPLVKTAIYRITQEAINNVARHAEASAVEIALRSDAREVVLAIRDNGEGMRGDVGQDSWGVGLRSMRERAALSGGELTIVSRDGGGVTLIARWPIEAASGQGLAGS